VWRLAARRPAVLRRRAALPAPALGVPVGFPRRPAEPRAVSELLAGGRSAPGRNPGAARARGLL